MTIPLRTRIAVWFVLLLALILAALGTFLIVELRRDLERAIDATLTPAAAQIRADIAEDGVADFPDAARSVLKGDRPSAQLIAADGRIVATFGDEAARRPMLPDAEIAAAARGEQPVVSRPLGPEEDDFRVTALAARLPDRQRYVIVAALGSESVDRAVGRLVRLLVLGGAGALLLAALAGWWLARRALRPIDAITTTAAAIGVDRLGERVPVGRAHDEVAHLAATLNTMLDRIEHEVGEQRRLVADASHELRTPLAVMRSELDVSLRGADLSPDARDVLLSARDEVDGLSRTVDDLLTLAAADDGPRTAVREEVELAALAADVIASLAAVAQRRGVEVVREGPAVVVAGDPVGLRHALRNVVENAIAFSPAGASVSVVTEATADGRGARLTVADEGPGIPEHLRERIFDRFFRVDPSRTRATGGSGLGLAITREIVSAHGGRVWVEPREPGSAFVIELPDRDA